MSADALPIRALRLFFGALPLVALLRQLSIHLGLGFDWVNFFSYYTTLSNLLGGCVLILSGAVRIEDRRFEVLRATAVINLCLVGLIFSTLLRDADVGSLLPWVNAVHHDLMPCVIVLDWLLVPPRVRLGARQLGLALVAPMTYVAYTLVRGARTGWYPYPFLNPGIAGGALGVALYVLGIAAAFVFVGWALIALGNMRRTRVGNLTA